MAPASSRRACTNCSRRNVGGVTQTGLTDPIRCPVTNDTGLDCNTQFGVLFGGNAALKPEESEQATFGIVFEPIPNASISLDYFKINLKNAIVNGIAPTTILGDLAQFGSLVTRARRPELSGLAGPDPARSTRRSSTSVRSGSRASISRPITARRRSRGAACRSTCQGTYYLRYDAQNPDGSYTGAVGNGVQHRRSPA